MKSTGWAMLVLGVLFLGAAVVSTSVPQPKVDAEQRFYNTIGAFLCPAVFLVPGLVLVLLGGRREARRREGDGGRAGGEPRSAARGVALRRGRRTPVSR